MAERDLSGIEDALEGLIGSSEQQPARSEGGPKRTSTRSRSESAAEKQSGRGRGSTSGGQSVESKPETDQQPNRETKIPQRTLTGRPQGRKNGEGQPKSRATVWVSTELIEEYRNRVWDERCHLGELIERALQEYKQRHW